MSKSLRGGNSAFRVQRQKQQAFAMNRQELEDTTKNELEEIAEDLGVLSRVEGTGARGAVLKSDLVDALERVTLQRHV